MDNNSIDLRVLQTHIKPFDLVKDIVSKSPTQKDPFFIFDLEEICAKHSNWLLKLPRIQPFYAVKCNTDPILLKLLAKLGTGFDCASQNEIESILKLVTQDQIIFSNPCKQASYITYSKEMGVDLMTFDNELELFKIKKLHPDAKLVLRVKTNDFGALFRLSMKFGADMESQAYSLIDVAFKLDLNLVGISFHVGSGQMSPKAFSESIKNSKLLFDYVNCKFGVKMSLLDIGGGFPGSAENNDLFDTISNEINNALDEHFPIDVYTDLKVIAEPGRYYACSAFTLCTNIIAKRVEDGFDSKSVMYYINDGLYSSFMCSFLEHSQPVPKVLGNKSGELNRSSIWGPTCSGLDLVNKECILPELDIGEYLLFEDMGAYTTALAVAFNGMPLAKCIYYVSTSWDLINDIFNGENIKTDHDGLV